jgi:hypothetical protein
MLRRRLAMCCAVMLATLIFPAHARAGLIDIIWEMTGPQMIGVSIRCRMSFRSGQNEKCVITLPVAQPGELALDPGPEKLWFALEGGAFVSTGKNSGDIDYKFGRIGMFAFEPMLEFRYAGDIGAAYSKKDGFGAVYGGVGPLINSFIVRGSTVAFAKYGVKLRPIAMVYSGWVLEYNVRLYTDKVTPDQFGFGPPMKYDRPHEFIHSIGVSIPWTRLRVLR